MGLSRGSYFRQWSALFAPMSDLLPPELVAPFCSNFLSLMGRRVRSLVLSGDQKKGGIEMGAEV